MIDLGMQSNVYQRGLPRNAIRLFHFILARITYHKMITSILIYLWNVTESLWSLWVHPYDEQAGISNKKEGVSTKCHFK